jgi:transcriptional regulator with XRE-family HTH domain
MREKRLSAEALSLIYLRAESGLTREELATALGRSTTRQVSLYEQGQEELSGETLEELAAALGQPREAIEVLRFAHELIAGPSDGEPLSFVELGTQEGRRIDRAALSAGLAVAAETRARLQAKRREEKAEAARYKAREQWEDLRQASPQERRRLVEIFPEFRHWALAEHVCAESVRAAARKVGEALEFADFALFLAECAVGPEPCRARLEGYAWGHVANARRVANDFAGAEAAFARAWELWEAGAMCCDGPLAGWRLLDLEASLLRAERRFPEALERLDQALATCAGKPTATARILLKREHVFDQMGDGAAALAALDEAAPWVERSEDPHLLLALRFKTVNHLCRQGRHEEAAMRISAVRELALEQRQELHLIRVVWLEARIDAGQGQAAEAMTKLEQVQRDFTARGLPYDVALSGLDLAVLWLEAGRATEVRRLAAGMGWIFAAQGIAREALAALQLFAEAARQELATVALVRQVIAEIESARCSTPRPLDG